MLGKAIFELLDAALIEMVLANSDKLLCRNFKNSKGNSSAAPQNFEQ